MDAMVDLRSDTVTKPTPEMRRAMAAAEVGDDGYGEDPTVRALEEAFAERVGKEAAVFVPSGTMGNQIAIRVLAEAGSAVVAGRRSHLVCYELGAAPRNAGIQFHPLDDTTGILAPTQVREAVAAAAYHQPAVSLISIEDTHMASGGTPWTLEEIAAVRAAAGTLPIHLDGARLFNAEVTTGIAAHQAAEAATTVMCCLSKGLGAPVGSLLAGPAELEGTLRLERKRLGGAMRQAGILAAAGLVALESMIERLADDHRRARRLAEVVAERWPAIDVDPDSTRTNIVVFSPPHPTSLLAHLAERNIRAQCIAPGVVRLITHHDIDDADLTRASVAIATAP